MMEEKGTVALTVEEKKQRCREILERGMNGLTKPKEPEAYSWFAWDTFTDDLLAALEELELAAKKQ